jgi:CheY-like chemotaxis protein
LVAHPHGEVAHTLSGLLTQMGYQADAAATGRGAYEIAAAHPDFGFLLLSDALDDPSVGQLVELLRQDLRTANLPIAVMYRIEIEPIVYTSETDELFEAAVQSQERLPGLYYHEDRLLAARRIAEGDPLTVAVPQFHTPETLELTVRRLAEISGSDFLTPRERLYFGQIALKALAQYAADPVKYAFYQPAEVQDSIVKAIDQPALALFAADALGMLGTARAQRTLADVASQNDRPLELRQAAAAAFRAAVARQHLQLSTKEILLQYDRYNLSAPLDRRTQAVLGHVLDTIEGKGEEPPSPNPPDVEKLPPAP